MKKIHCFEGRTVVALAVAALAGCGAPCGDGSVGEETDTHTSPSVQPSIAEQVVLANARADRELHLLARKFVNNDTEVVEFYDHTGSAKITLNATLPANGVSAAPSSCGDKKYFGQDQVTVINANNIDSLTLTIKVATTTGVAYSNQYETFTADVRSAHSAPTGFIQYTFTLASGTIANDIWVAAAQWAGNGTLHATTGDTWTLTTHTSAGSSTVSGHF